MRDIVSAANAAAISTSPASAASVSHHRSASDDAQQHQQLITDDLKYLHNTPAWSGRVSGSDAARTSRGTQRPAAAVFRRDTMPPIHLMSATNEVRSGLVQPQQLPLKLASSSDSAARRPRWTSGSPATVSSSRSPSEHLLDSQPIREDPGQAGRNTPDQQLFFSPAGRCEFSAGEGEATGHNDLDTTKRSAALLPTSIGLRQSTGTAMTAAKYAMVTSSSTASIAGTSCVMSKSSPSASSVLPMKLAERQRPKSASSPTIQPTSTSMPSGTRATAGAKSHTRPSKTSGASVISSVRSSTSPGNGQLTSTAPHVNSFSPEHFTHSAISNHTPLPVHCDKEIIYF